jgi:TRAP-type mannitol/chloroaromatic compound transport system permease small subunit
VGHGKKTDSGSGSAADPARERSHAEGIVEKTCMLLCGLALVVLLVLVGGYMLVAIAFLSLPVSHINGAFHRVEFIQARLSRRARLISRFCFDLVALIVCAIFVWHFMGLVRSSWRFGDYAPTFLETPLWIPRSLLVLGMGALCLSLLRSLAADLRRLWVAESAERERDGT